VTRLRSHFLGISIQYWTEKEGLTVKTLALVDTEAKNDGAHTKILVLDVLSKFGINKSDILACVVDNAANMTQTVRLMNEDAEDDDDDEGEDEEDDDEELANMPQIDETIHHVRCAEHTLQLGIRDGLKKAVATFIAKLRAIVQLLRAPHADAILKRRTGKGALIDMPTRWGSLFLMLKRLLELKNAVQDLALTGAHLTEYEWEKVERLVSVLEIPHKATISLQKEKLTPGECLMEWREVVFKLEKLGGVWAHDIAGAYILSKAMKFCTEQFLSF
jgi:hypothetical protein